MIVGFVADHGKNMVECVDVTELWKMEIHISAEGYCDSLWGWSKKSVRKRLGWNCDILRIADICWGGGVEVGVEEG